jgi:DNA-binding transcriptional regulator YhcF (GntR family)
MGKNSEILSLKLNYASSLPLFLQAAYLLNRKISEGKLTAEGLPTVKEISASSHIPMPVIEQAYKTLTKQAVLAYEKSRGYYLPAPLKSGFGN